MKDTWIQIRSSTEKKRRFQAAAETVGRSLSNFMEWAATKAAEEIEERERKEAEEYEPAAARARSMSDEELLQALRDGSGGAIEIMEATKREVEDPAFKAKRENELSDWGKATFREPI